MAGKKNNRRKSNKPTMRRDQQHVQNNEISSTSVAPKTVGVTAYIARQDLRKIILEESNWCSDEISIFNGWDITFNAAGIKMILMWKQFSITPYPNSEEIKRLSHATNISENNIQTWFKCKRNALKISWNREKINKWNEAGKCKCFSCARLYSTASGLHNRQDASNSKNNSSNPF